MKYSFFGTCYEDSFLLFDCLKSIELQSVKANELILIDSSLSNSILREISKIFKDSKTSIVYKKVNLPRVKALNYAISLATSEYLLRFDSRTRFSKNYAEEAIKLLNEKNKIKLTTGAVGGRQSPLPANSTKKAKLASELFERSYVFGNPLYRRKKYSGKVNSIYLGCFPKEILQKTKYRDRVNLISEDSQLSKDIISQGYLIYISQNIKVNYLCRENIFLVMKLLRNYGRCRARTIISTRTIHDKKKYFLLLILIFVLPIFLFSLIKDITISFLLVLLIPIIYNTFYEILNYGLKKILYMPLIALLAQLNWIIGVLETLLLYFFVKNKKSNFLK